jgi:hypothetical protein
MLIALYLCSKHQEKQFSEEEKYYKSLKVTRVFLRNFLLAILKSA